MKARHGLLAAQAVSDQHCLIPGYVDPEQAIGPAATPVMVDFTAAQRAPAVVEHDRGRRVHTARCSGRTAVKPPSTGSTWPVIQLA